MLIIFSSAVWAVQTLADSAQVLLVFLWNAVLQDLSF